MKTSCLHATLLSLFLFVSALPEKQCKVCNHNCEENLGCIPEIRRVVVQGTVSVPCPSFTGSEMIFTLCQGTNHYSVTSNFTRESAQKNVTVDISHQLNPEDNSTMFVLKNVTEDQTGLYTCQAKITFPPPSLPATEIPPTIVIVEETQQQTARRCDPPTSHLSLWAGLGVLTMYGLIVTYAAFSLRSRLTKADLNKHDYMNVRPRARRRKGILHPARLSWYSDNTSSIVSCNLSKRLPN